MQCVHAQRRVEFRRIEVELPRSAAVVAAVDAGVLHPREEEVGRIGVARHSGDGAVFQPRSPALPRVAQISTDVEAVGGPGVDGGGIVAVHRQEEDALPVQFGADTPPGDSAVFAAVEIGCAACEEEIGVVWALRKRHHLGDGGHARPAGGPIVRAIAARLPGVDALEGEAHVEQLGTRPIDHSVKESRVFPADECPRRVVGRLLPEAAAVHRGEDAARHVGIEGDGFDGAGW